jgi:hypothetical protein
LGMAVAAVAMMLSAGFANAAVGSSVSSLRTLSAHSSVQSVKYHRHCWWHHHHRVCR